MPIFPYLKISGEKTEHYEYSNQKRHQIKTVATLYGQWMDVSKDVDEIYAGLG